MRFAIATSILLGMVLLALSSRMAAVAVLLGTALIVSVDVALVRRIMRDIRSKRNRDE